MEGKGRCQLKAAGCSMMSKVLNGIHYRLAMILLRAVLDGGFTGVGAGPILSGVSAVEDELIRSGRLEFPANLRVLQEHVVWYLEPMRLNA
jgi:hypothetical protein